MSVYRGSARFLERRLMLVQGGAVRSVCSGRCRFLLTVLAATLAVGCVPGLAGALPPGWSYELASPADPLQSDVSYGIAAPEGGHAWMQTVTPMVDGQPSGNITTVEATRLAGVGWQDASLADPAAPGSPSYGFAAASGDGSRVILQGCDQTFLGCRGAFRFQRVEQDGSRITMLNVPRSAFLDPVPTFAGNSTDLARIFVQNAAGAPPLLSADTHVHGQGLYASDNGQVEFLGFDQNETVLPCGEILANDTQVFIGSGFEQNGLSADGSTVVFESPDPAAINNDPTDCPGPVDIYVRRGGKTFDISAPANASPDLGATYVGNSQDGNTVYFVTSSQLVPVDTDPDPDVYAADMTTSIPTITRLTPDANITNDSGPRVVVSPGGDFVYFEASNQINGQGSAGEPNLYVYHAGTVSFIATASSGHFALGNPLTSGQGSPVTPDGRHLVFVSPASLTGQPTGDRRMIFQYTFGAGIKCVSCRPDGNPPVTSDNDVISNSNPPAQLDQRVQSDDGTRVFFATLEPLLPEDISPAIDVYMWQDDGTPNGKLSLISSGQSPHGSGLVGANADGTSVLFTSYDRLLPGVDQDAKKVYAARQGGGFPLPPGVKPRCMGDACQPQPAARPALAAVPSATYQGPGNTLAPAPTLTIGRLSIAAKRTLARTGRLTLTIRTTVPTAIQATLTARIGKHQLTVGSASKRLSKAARTRLTIHLTGSARNYLKAHHTLKVRLTVTSTDGIRHTLAFTLHT
jgi:hypothetical protein